jgi:Na+-transporting NADH:ubiquinone oxidoreductase subunit NqrA
MGGFKTLIKGFGEWTLLPCKEQNSFLLEDTVITVPYWKQTGPFPNTNASTLILDFLASRTIRNKFMFIVNYQVFGILL